MKKFVQKISDYIRHTDIALLLFCVAASGISVASLLAMSHSDYIDLRIVFVQLAASGCGFIAAIVLSRFDYHTLARLWKLHLPMCVILVLLTFVIGQGVGDADDVAWIPLIGGMSLQPTEVLKISFILTFAYHLSRVADSINEFKSVLQLGLHAGALILLVHFQGDDGTALIFALMFLCMMFVAGWSWWYLAGLAAAGAAAAPLVWFFIMNDQQRMRILALYVDSADTANILYQQKHGLVAIGSGQLLGTGLFSGSHSYVPAMRNDFIFAFIGEAMGFVGCLLVVLLLTGIIVRVIWTSHLALDGMGKFICIGVFAMLAFQAIINIGMVLCLLPVVGVTLPFFSAGGTSVVSTYLGIGLVLSVYMHSRRNLFLD